MQLRIISAAMAFKRVRTEPPWSKREPDLQDELILRGETRSEPWGFGLHPSSSLCLSILCGIYSDPGPRPKRMIELACGSGLLTVAAAKLGAESAAGSENDSELRKLGEENALGNHAIARFIASSKDAGAPFDLTLANLKGLELPESREEMSESASEESGCFKAKT